MVRLILGLAACAAAAMADVTFNVVGLRDDKSKNMFGVLINGKVTQLTTSTATYPLWTGKLAGVKGPIDYKYVELDAGGKVKTTEEDVRKLPADIEVTANEFFGRAQTKQKLPRLPQVYENKLQQNSPFFSEGYVSTMFIEGKESELANLNKGGESWYPDDIKVNMQYIGEHSNVKISNVTFNLSGKSAREFAKLAYKLKFPKKNKLQDLKSIKLRNEETDATMMREMLYVDILNSIGVPAQQSAYVRVYLNKKPIGLFVAQEEMKEHWIKTVLHPGSTTKPGSLWKMNQNGEIEGNLQYLGPKTKNYDTDDIYHNVILGNNPKDEPMKELIAFMKLLQDYDPKATPDPIAFWNKHIDLDMFLKSMAMEYLAGAWDAYWNTGSNFQLYNDPVTGKWSWFPTDFDDTFGTSYEGKVETYKKIPKVNENGFSSPMAQKLIMETPVIQKRFDEIVKDIVSYVFKPEALTPRLNAYAKLIQDDVTWDRKQPRVAAKGKKEDFSGTDLKKGLGNGVGNEWGVTRWIETRFKQVQKDMNFKAVPGTPDRVEAHYMQAIQDPKEQAKIKAALEAKKKAAAGAAAPKAPVKDEKKNNESSASSSSPSDSDKKPESDAPTSDSQVEQSDVDSSSLKSSALATTSVKQWAVAGVAMVAAVFVL